MLFGFYICLSLLGLAAAPDGSSTVLVKNTFRFIYSGNELENDLFDNGMSHAVSDIPGIAHLSYDHPNGRDEIVLYQLMDPNLVVALSAMYAAGQLGVILRYSETSREEYTNACAWIASLGRAFKNIILFPYSSEGREDDRDRIHTEAVMLAQTTREVRRANPNVPAVWYFAPRDTPDLPALVEKIRYSIEPHRVEQLDVSFVQH